MGEAVESLVVKLALDNSGFTKGIQNMNRDIRKATSEFKNSSAGGKDFEKSLDGLSAKSKMLTSQISSQTNILKAYQEKASSSRSRLEELKDSQTKLKGEMDEVQKRYQSSIIANGENADRTKKLKEEVETLSNEYTNNEEKIRNNVRTLNNYEIKVNDAEAKLKNLKASLNDTNKEIEVQSSSLTKASKHLESFGNKAKAIGEATQNLGKGMTKYLTAPLAGLAVISSKIGMDFEASMSNIQALATPTAEEFDMLEKKAREMGAATSKSAKDAADGLGYMALAGWKTNDMINGIEPVLRLAEAGNIDLARASSLVTDSMSAMGIEVQDLMGYLDIVAQTARNSNTDIDQMMEAYLGVGGTLRGLNVPLKDSSVALGMLANAGIKGSEGGTALNAVLLNLTAPTGKAKNALKELNYTAFDSGGKFKGLTKVLMDVNEKTKGMTEAQRNQIFAMIGGKEHVKALNALMNGLGDSYGDLSLAIDGADGALMDMAHTMQDNNKGSLTELKSALEELALKIYDVLRPTIANIIEILQKWTDKLNNLSPEQQKTIVNIAKFVAVAGPFLMIVGKLISGIGGIALNFSMLSGAAAASGTTIAAVASGFVAAAAPVIGTIAAITAVVAGVGFGLYKLNKHLKESSLEIEVFDDSISETTKNAVGNFLEMDDEISKSLLSLKTSSAVITKETADGITKQYSEMGSAVIEELTEQKKEAEILLNNLFKNTGNIDDEEIRKRVDEITESYNNEIEVVKNYKEEVKNILETAAKENRDTTLEEDKRMAKIQEEIRTAGVRTLSETEAESKVILQNLKDNRSEINADILADVVKSSLEQKDKAVETAQSEYEEIIKIAEQTRAQGGAINEEKANKLLELAKLQKNNAIKEAEETHEGVVKEAKQQAEEHVDYVDWETGEALSKWEKWNVDQTKKADERRVRQEKYINDLKAMFKEKFQEIIDGFKADGEAIANWFKGYGKRTIENFKKMGKDMAKTGKQNVQDMINDMKAFKADMAKIGEQLMDGLKEGIKKFASKPINAIKETGEKIKSKAKAVFDIHSPSKVFEEDGKYLMEGWAVGIDKNSKLAEDALTKAAQTLKDTSSDLTISPKMSFSIDNIKTNTSNAFNKKQTLDDYSDYLRKLNADELEVTKKHLEELNKLREKALNKQIDTTKNKNAKAKYREEKKALKEHNGDIKSLIDDRIRSLDEASKLEANILNSKMDSYDESIKRLKIETDDLNNELSNNAAIVILQSKKVEELAKEYDRLVDSFGSTAKESINVKKNLESARTELIKMQEEVEKTNQKIKDEQIKSINNLHTSLVSALKKRYEEEGKIREEALNKEIADLDKWKDESIKRVNEVYDNKIKKIDEVANAQIKAIEDELKSMEKQEQEKSRDEVSSSYNKNINDLQESIMYEHDEYNKAKLEKKLAEEKAKFKEQQEAWTLEDKKAKLKENIDIIKENAAEEKEILSLQKQEELERIDGLYTFEREVLESKMNDNRDFLQQMTDDKQLQAEAEKMILNTQQQDMLDLLKQYEPGYEKAGYNLGQKLVDGVAPQIQKVIDMMNYMYATLGLDNHITIADHIRVQNKQMKEFRPPEVVYRDSANLFGDNDYRLPEKTINNTVNFNSPKALDPSEQRKLTERQLNRLSFNM